VVASSKYSQNVTAAAGAQQYEPTTLTQLDANDQAIVLSVIIPTYNGADCLKPLYERLVAVLLPITNSFELVFVEDRGPDASWERLVEMASRLPYIRAVQLSRNFGQQAAITAGLSICRGEWAAVIDCDLEDPPEEIATMWKKAQEGYDLVLARRLVRKQSVFRRTFSQLYFGLLSLFCLSKVNGDFGSLSLLSRKVIDAYLSFSDRNRHYMMIVQWLGFDRAEIDYEQSERFAGKSSYSIFSLIRLAAQGFLFQTTVLLQLIVAAGLFVSVLGLAGLGWTLWIYMTHANVPAGWTSVIDTLLFLGGLILISIGVVGMYVGEIFDQVKERPLYLFGKEVRSGSVPTSRPN